MSLGVSIMTYSSKLLLKATYELSYYIYLAKQKCVPLQESNPESFSPKSLHHGRYTKHFPATRFDKKLPHSTFVTQI